MATPTHTPTAIPLNEISPSEGGAITATVGVTVSVVFSPGTVVEPVEVVIEPVADTHPHSNFRVVGQIFHVMARTRTGGSVTSFSAPFLLTIHYGSLPIRTGASPLLYFWRDRDKKWVEIPSVHDPHARTLTATLDHLTTFAAMQQERYLAYIPMLVR